MLSGDGKSLYAAAGDDAAVARFRRKRDTGRLTYRGCLSGDSESACREIPDATPGGFGEESGLDNPQSLALSGDGRSLYAASFGDARWPGSGSGSACSPAGLVVLAAGVAHAGPGREDQQ